MSPATAAARATPASATVRARTGVRGPRSPASAPRAAATSSAQLA